MRQRAHLSYACFLCVLCRAQAPTPCTFGPEYTGRKYNAEVRLPLDLQTARFAALAGWHWRAIWRHSASPRNPLPVLQFIWYLWGTPWAFIVA